MLRYIIGEPIDEYVFGDMVGLTSKDPAISLVKKYKKLSQVDRSQLQKFYQNLQKSELLYIRLTKNIK